MRFLWEQYSSWRMCLVRCRHCSKRFLGGWPCWFRKVYPSQLSEKWFHIAARLCFLLLAVATGPAILQIIVLKMKKLFSLNLCLIVLSDNVHVLSWHLKAEMHWSPSVCSKEKILYIWDSKDETKVKVLNYHWNHL